MAKINKAGDVVLTQKQRDDLIQSALKHTEKVNALRPTYPSPHDKLTLDQLRALGFTDAHHVMVVRDGEDFDDLLGFHHGRRRNKNKKNRGSSQQGGTRGGGGSRGGNGGGKTLPDPNMVASEVERALSSTPVADMTGDIVLGEQNFENLEETKANFFAKAINSIVSRTHIMFCVEVSPKGIAVMGNNTGYSSYVSQANNRQQAVGFLVHKRLKVLKVSEYSNVANVFGIPDLRSAFRLDLEDTVTGIQFSVVVVHLKSMRGGEAKTDPVAMQQCKELVKSLGNGLALPLPAVGNLRVFPWFKNPKLGRTLTDHGLCLSTLRLDKVTCVNGNLIVIAGDWNRKLDTTRALDPLYQAGWLLIYKGDKTATQIMGPSRLDGFVGNGDNDTSCGGGNGGNPHGPFSNDPTDNPEVDVTK
jgi:hypothetical protein